MPWVGTVLGMSCLEYELSWVWFVMGTSWPGHKVTQVRVVLGTSCPGYEFFFWGTSCLGYELTWVRIILGTSCLGYELSRVRVVLGTSCFIACRRRHNTVKLMAHSQISIYRSRDTDECIYITLISIAYDWCSGRLLVTPYHTLIRSWYPVYIFMAVDIIRIAGVNNKLLWIS